MKNRDGAEPNDHWETPPAFYKSLDDEFHFDFDPCPLHAEFDGLSPFMKWGKSNFINPPYNRKDKPQFIRRAYEEWRDNAATCVLLIPAAVSTADFHEIILPNAEIRFPRGRLAFIGTNTKGEKVTTKKGKHDSMVVIFHAKKSPSFRCPQNEEPKMNPDPEEVEKAASKLESELDYECFDSSLRKEIISAALTNILTAQSSAFQARLDEKEAEVERLKQGHEEQVHSLNRQIHRLYSAKEAAERQVSALREVSRLQDQLLACYRTGNTYREGIISAKLSDARRAAESANATAEAHDARVRAEAFEEANDLVAGMGRSDGCSAIKARATAERAKAEAAAKGENKR